MTFIYFMFKRPSCQTVKKQLIPNSSNGPCVAKYLRVDRDVVAHYLGVARRFTGTEAGDRRVEAQEVLFDHWLLGRAFFRGRT